MLELTFNHDGRTYDLGTGYGHIAVSVDDLEQSLGELKEQGIEPEREPYRVREGGSLICFVQDPDGYRIELIDRSGSSESRSVISPARPRLDRGLPRASVLSAAFGAGDQYLGRHVFDHRWRADVACSRRRGSCSRSSPAPRSAIRGARPCSGSRARSPRSLGYFLLTDSPLEGAHYTLANPAASSSANAPSPRRHRHRPAVRLVRPAVADAPRDRGRARRGRGLLPRAARAHGPSVDPIRIASSGSPRSRSGSGSPRRCSSAGGRTAQAISFRALREVASVWPEASTSEHVRRLQSVTDAALAHLRLDELLAALLERHAPDPRGRHVRDPPARRGDERARRARRARDRGGGRAGRPRPGRRRLRRAGSPPRSAR